ncbi:Vms1/Ankzf1 family peptidyl-tRNA hydrolase [Actinocrispum sp. NPDC049592]|uniref:Rv2629 family ribosome hibernation factor n=1 Tax=Actinocrispum sp. NPDC049592 TaxID=3154835 RepID=UPI003434F586
MRALHWITETDGPFAAAYYDGSHETEDAERQLELRWRSARDQLKQQGADEATLEAMDKAALDPAPGRALVAARGTVLLDEELAVPPVLPEARYSAVPYLLPLARLAPRDLPYVVVITDRTGADVRIGGRRAETVQGREFPVHKVRGGGWAHHHIQARVEEVARQNMDHVAREVAKLCDEQGARLLIVAGEVQSRAELLGRLPPRAKQIAVETDIGRRGEGWNTKELDQEVVTLVTTKAEAEVAAEIESRRGGQLYVHGLKDTLNALSMANVDALLISEAFDGERPIWLGPQRNVVALSEAELIDLGMTEVQQARADEALPVAALAVDADIIPVGEPLDDGIGALLRHT